MYEIPESERGEFGVWENPRSVHVAHVEEPHWLGDDGVCWCDPEIEDYTEECGKILVIHRRLQ